MTYGELTVFGKLRKEYGCGPFAMFCKLIHMWGDKMSPEEVCMHVYSVTATISCTVKHSR